MCDGPGAVDLPSIDEVLADPVASLLAENGTSVHLVSRPSRCRARFGNPGTTAGTEMWWDPLGVSGKRDAPFSAAQVQN